MKLEKKAREQIYEQLKENPKMTKKELKEIIRQHYIKDVDKLVDQDLGRLANALMAKYRDENNIRKIFAYNNDKETTYINVEKSDEKEILEIIKENMEKKRNGLNHSIAKITSRLKVLENQISIDELQATEVR